jgi:hypothetical protein
VLGPQPVEQQDALAPQRDRRAAGVDHPEQVTPDAFGNREVDGAVVASGRLDGEPGLKVIRGHDRGSGVPEAVKGLRIDREHARSRLP